MTTRTFPGCRLRWTCEVPRSRWWHTDYRGRFTLTRYGSRGQTAGWYLDRPDASGDWMGDTLTAAAQAAELLIAEDEIVLTRENLAGLCEAVELSKPHYRTDPSAARGVAIDGLTLLDGHRRVAYFGDALIPAPGGSFTIRPATTEDA